MTDVFISYRRDDTGYIADSIYNELSTRYPNVKIYMDIATAPKVGNFITEIEAQVHGCNILLLLMGSSWKDTLEKRVRENSKDIVIQEIEFALEEGKPILPILVDGAVFPPTRILPESVSSLAQFKAIEIRRSPYTKEDMEKLIKLVHPFVFTSTLTEPTKDIKIDFSDL